MFEGEKVFKKHSKANETPKVERGNSSILALAELVVSTDGGTSTDM